MNIWMQLGIGVTAAALIMWLLCIAKKVRNAGRFVYTGVITAAGIALLVCGFLFRTPAREEEVSPLTREEQVEFAYAFVEQGEYAVARELMQEYGSRYGYDDECSLFAARIDLLQGNYATASGVYERLQADSAFEKQIAGEYELVRKKANVNLSQAATVKYLMDSGKNPTDYGYSEDIITVTREGLQITDEMIREAVLTGIAEEYKTKDFQKTVGDVAEATRLYELCQSDYYGTPDETTKAEIEAVRKSLTKKMDDGESYCACVRNALLQMNLLLGDYEEIAENINDRSTYVELMVIAELYMENLVREKDFKNTYIGALAEEMDQHSDVVGKKVKEVYKDNKKSLSEEKEEELELLVDYWKIEAKHPILTNIRKLMEDRVREDKVGADASKVYLQLAKVAHYYENEKNRSSRLAEAIDTGSDCEDDEYSAAMEKINAIINGEGDISEVLNVSDYVERALQRAMPYGMDAFLQAEPELQLYSNDEDEEEEREQPAPGKEFSEIFEEYVNKTRSAVNISEVDTEKFETVKVRVAVSSDYATTADRLKKVMKLSDCGFEIEEFTVEKLEYTEGRTHLACDVSGSMSGYIEDLRQAVVAYINGRNPKELLAISTFSNYIEQTMPFGSTKEELTNFAGGFYASGGTSIYRTIIEILNNFDSTVYSNNAIILMTDGIDGYSASDATIAGEMASLAAEKNVKVYTIGLGDVNAEYLTKIAEAGGGVFVHTRESGGLDSLYAFLQGQVDNQYVVTFKAKDTLTAKNRLLEISINNGEAKSDVRYSLAIGTNSGNSGNGGNGGNSGNTGNAGGNSGNSGNGGNTGNTGSMGTGSIVADETEEALPVSTLRLTGLDVKKIHQNKTGCTNSVRTYAPEFSEGMIGSIRLISCDNPDQQYAISLKYKDKCVAEFIVPRSIREGTYDAEVIVDGKKGYLKQCLEIAEIKLDSVYRFGSYEFTAENKKDRTDGGVYLSGNVVMNGWLRFRGGVVIQPDPYDDSFVYVTDNTGSKVEFDSVSAVGFGKRMAKENLPVYVPKLGKFKLYKDAIHTTDFSEYTTDDIAAEELFVAKLFCVPHLSIQLFPDRMEIAYKEVQTKLPFQDVLFGEEKSNDPYKVKWEDQKIILTGENLGATISYEAKKNDNYPVLNTVVDVTELEFSIDTIEDEYSFGIMMELLEFPEAGASITLKGGDVDSCSITYDKSLTKMFGPVPITFSGFTFGVEGGDIGEKLKNKEFHKITYVGAMDISTASVSDLVPKLKNYFGKDAPALLTMPETTLKLTPAPFCFSGNASLKLLDTVELANAEFNLGQFRYTNELLELHDVTTVGVNAKLAIGFKWEEDDAISVDVGAAGVLNVHSKFTGVQVEDAHVTAKLEWWIFDFEVDKHADMLMGFTESKHGGAQFNVIFASRDGKKSKKDWFYINQKDGRKIEHS